MRFLIVVVAAVLAAGCCAAPLDCGPRDVIGYGEDELIQCFGAPDWIDGSSLQSDLQVWGWDQPSTVCKVTVLGGQATHVTQDCNR